MSLEITWHNLEPSPAVEAGVRKRFEKLATICPDILGARVAIDQPHRSQQHPRKYSVTLDIHLPGNTVVADHAGSEETSTDLHQLVHHTFDAARRQVLEFTRIRNGKVKRHSAPVAPEISESSDPEQT